MTAGDTVEVEVENIGVLRTPIVSRAQLAALRDRGCPNGQDFYNTHRPHRALNQAAPLRPLPDGVTDLDHFRVRQHDRAGGVIYEYRLVA